MAGHPDCEWCEIPAQYDFKGSDGLWHYGCTGHWMQHRESKAIKPGCAQHLIKGQEVPPSMVPQEQRVTKCIKPSQPKPEVPRPPIRSISNVVKPSLDKAKTTGRVPRMKEFQDMEAGPVQKEWKPNSVGAIMHDLLRKGPGATVEEINTAIGYPKHDALKLMQFSNANRGWGYAMIEGKVYVKPQ